MLNKNKSKLKCCEETDRIFDSVKNIWSESLECYMPNKKDIFSLETDASNVDIGAVLKQNNISITYISRVLKVAERNYSITEKETLGALWSMEKFEKYLLGKKFFLIGDHKALEEIFEKKDFVTLRIQRWIERFSKFNFSVCYREGSKTVQAIALSRMFTAVRKQSESDLKATENLLIKFHRENSHMKSISDILKRKNIDISQKRLYEIFKKM
ncbi:Retrovirus-related Pol polyprotein from transposon 17.6 [Dictyocoela muelleri]|nr:Retrovirus-related Pol polyprotein from transposon 17.6 [Dictyocoela muelleri]